MTEPTQAQPFEERRVDKQDVTHACPHCYEDTDIRVFPQPQLDAEAALAEAVELLEMAKFYVPCTYDDGKSLRAFLARHGGAK